MSPSRSDRKNCRHILAGAVLTLLMPASLTWAGDDVDYSAPYLVVENGELVTKYPAIEHEAGESDPAATRDAENQVNDGGNSRTIWGIVAVALAIVIAILVHSRRRAKSGGTDAAD